MWARQLGHAALQSAPGRLLRLPPPLLLPATNDAAAAHQSLICRPATRHGAHSSRGRDHGPILACLAAWKALQVCSLELGLLLPPLLQRGKQR